jgi:hypothetical protein
MDKMRSNLKSHFVRRGREDIQLHHNRAGINALEKDCTHEVHLSIQKNIHHWPQGDYPPDGRIIAN